MQSIKVGKHEIKVVTKLNNTLYLKAKKIMTDDINQHFSHHMGLVGVSAFVNWLESNYTITKK